MYYVSKYNQSQTTLQNMFKFNKELTSYVVGGCFSGLILITGLRGISGVLNYYLSKLLINDKKTIKTHILNEMCTLHPFTKKWDTFIYFLLKNHLLLRTSN